MDRTPICVMSATSVGSATQLFIERRLSCLPVIQYAQEEQTVKTLLIGLITRSDLLRAFARAMGVFEPVFSFNQTPEEISGPRLLSEIATQTGGRAFAAAVPGDMPSVANRIAIELRNQYVVGYYPKNKARDGKYRNVEVQVTQPTGIASPLKVHWRLGYYAPSQ